MIFEIYAIKSLKEHYINILKGELRVFGTSGKERLLVWIRRGYGKKS
ncbi:MAG: hypothetical protein IIW54_10955 [Lachnospiraceae bacterium]|nr:hypothetical protein [Lachnospiraceae bacterium]MBQ2406105.1 hypothetical protein [Lachnospiraceae bacterium]MBQ5851311.1 hypothetical protein [Lachnospiraceae bacterium]MEE0920321.1 hypothetical protein [Lachnospiraceae bacterium]